MKHLKTFESYSVNEEEGKFASFFTGHGSKEEKNGKIAEFNQQLDAFEAEANADDNIVFNRTNLEKQAKENKYKGKLEKRSSRSGSDYIIYVAGRSGLEDAASAAAGKVANPLN